METQKPLLDWQRIHDWAFQQEPGRIGESCINSGCPLARYLYDQTGKPWTVGPSIRPADGTKSSRLEKPVWVNVLLSKVDNSTDGKRGPVTREQFLEVLEEVKPTHTG